MTADEAYDRLHGLDSCAQSPARALRDAARFFEREMSRAWGGDAQWLTTGTRVAGVVADVLREEAADLDAERVADVLRELSTDNDDSEGVGTGAGEGAGCVCAELCSMGPTCPGGMLAGLPGSGCWRMACPDGRQHSWMQWPDGATRCRHCGEEAHDA